MGYAAKFALAYRGARLMTSQFPAWQPIETAPKDGRTVKLRTADGLEFDASYEFGFSNSGGEDCCCWVGFVNHPIDWTDGVCWAVNEDHKQSTLPTHWLPEAPE